MPLADALTFPRPLHDGSAVQKGERVSGASETDAEARLHTSDFARGDLHDLSTGTGRVRPGGIEGGVLACRARDRGERHMQRRAPLHKQDDITGNAREVSRLTLTATLCRLRARYGRGVHRWVPKAAFT